MKHLRKVSSVRRADAYSDYLNALYRDTIEFIYAKKNEVAGTG